jgi:hypothetical protein
MKEELVRRSVPFVGRSLFRKLRFARAEKG